MNGAVRLKGGSSLGADSKAKAQRIWLIGGAKRMGFLRLRDQLASLRKIVITWPDRSCRSVTWRDLSSRQDSEYPQEQDDDVHVQRCRAVDGVVERLGNGVCPSPIVADVATEDEHHYPVDDIVMDAE
jgi:hypothetical protein